MEDVDAGSRPTGWDRALLVVVAATAAFGLVMVLARRTTARAFELLVFGSAESVVPDAADAYVGFVYGVLGAVMIGWMVALLPIVRGPLRAREPWAWNAVAGSVAVWFVVDSTLSVSSGFGENALLNLAFLAAFAIPLGALRGELRRR